MKKLIIVMMLAFLGIASSNAQVYTYKSYAFAEKKPGYAWSNFVNSNLTITINLNTDVIRIYNKMNSRFNVYNTRTVTDNDGETQLCCDSYDEEGLRCVVRLIIRYDGTSQIYVDYNNVSWCFNVRRIS